MPVGAGTPDSLDLVRAVASQVTANQRRELAVGPLFVLKTGARAGGITSRDSAGQRLAANAFAEALGVPIVKLPPSPDSARAALDSTTEHVGIVAILVQSDFAYVDLTFAPSIRSMHGEWFFTAYSYPYLREQGRWSFVPREWLGSA